MEKLHLKHYRQETGKTQAVCAKELGITSVYYSDIEREVKLPSPSLAIKIEAWSNNKIKRSVLRPDLWGHMQTIPCTGIKVCRLACEPDCGVRCPGYQPDEDAEAERVRELMEQVDRLKEGCRERR